MSQNTYTQQQFVNFAEDQERTEQTSGQIYDSLRRNNVAEMLNQQQYPAESSQQTTTPRRSNPRWSTADEERLIEYFKESLRITRMSSHQNSGRRMQTEARIWEAVTRLFNESASVPRSRDALEKKFRLLKAKFNEVFDEFKSTGRNGEAPNLRFKHYKSMWNCEMLELLKR